MRIDARLLKIGTNGEINGTVPDPRFFSSHADFRIRASNPDPDNSLKY
jgi:hypothetical protein